MAQKLKSLSLVFLVFISGLVLYANLQGLFYNCFNAVDFSIYLQTVYEITEGNFNPYITVRALRFFNDHFDPVIFLPALFLKIFGAKATTLMIFEWLTIMAAIFFTGFTLKKKYPLWQCALLATLIILNKPVLIALRFPVHPSTWTVLPVILLGYFLIQKNYLGVFLVSLGLISVKESYPFAMFMLSFFYLLQKDVKKFLGLFLTSLVCYVLIYKIRPIMLGPVMNYGKDLVATSEKMGFLEYGWHVVSTFKYFDVFKNFLPCFVALGLFLYQQKKSNQLKRNHPLWGMILYMTPLAMIQFLGNRFDFHYGPQFVAALIPFLFFTDFTDWLFERKKIAIFFFLIFVFNAGSETEKIISQSFFHKKKGCHINPEKKAAVHELVERAESLPITLDIASSGGVINQILRPGMKIHHIKAYSKVPDYFQVLVLEMHPDEYSWPLSPETIQGIYQKCSPKIVHTLISNKYYVMVEGSFSSACLE